MTLAGRVLHQARIARAKHVLGAIAETDLELAGQDGHELAARRGMSVEKPSDGPLTERDLRRCEALRPLGSLREVDRLDARLSPGIGEQAERSHRKSS